MFKYAFLMALCISFSINSYATKISSGEVDFSVNGSFRFIGATRSQKKLSEEQKKISPYGKTFVLDSVAQLNTVVSRTTDNNITYGASISLVATNALYRGLSNNGSHLYFISDFGKIELGSPHDAAAKMRISGTDVSAGGGSWDDYAVLETTGSPYKISFALGESFCFGGYKSDKLKGVGGTEPSRKISYYTPEYNGFQIGVSFIPDSNNLGDDEPMSGSDIGKKKIELKGDKENISVIEFNNALKNGVSLGLSHVFEIDDGISINNALTAEFAQAAGKATFYNLQNKDGGTEESNLKKLGDYKLKSVRTFNVGSILKYGNLSFALSYGNLFSSLTNKELFKTGRNVYYYSAGVSYAIADAVVSLTYFYGNKFKSKTSSITAATSYKILPGLETFLEFNYFNANGKHFYYPKSEKEKFSGIVTVWGIKVVF